MGTVAQKRSFTALGLIIGLTCIVTGGYFFATQVAKQPILKVPTAAPVRQQVADAPKTTKQLQAYHVPVTHPRELIIPKLGVDALVLPMYTTDGVLNAPASAWDVGWYTQSALPSDKSSSAALLIDGHVNDALNSPGVFYKLNTLQAGDTMTIYKGDNTTVGYTVLKVQQVPTDKVDMNGMLRSILPGRQGLNLITCGGTYNTTTKTYNDRVLVYAVQG